MNLERSETCAGRRLPQVSALKAVTIGLLITRFLDSIWITMIISYLMSFAMMVAIAVSFGSGVWTIPVLVMFDFILSVLAVYLSNYAMKRSRYDKKN